MKIVKYVVKNKDEFMKMQKILFVMGYRWPDRGNDIIPNIHEVYSINISMNLTKCAMTSGLVKSYSHKEFITHDRKKFLNMAKENLKNLQF